MEVNFKRTYVSPKYRFALGEIEAMNGYAMEITDAHPQLAEGKLQPGETMLILFGITSAEYALRGTDEKKLGELAAQIQKHYPADRLIGYIVRDLKGSIVNRDVKLKTELSIDGGAFVRDLPKKSVAGTAADAALQSAAQLQKAAMAEDAPQDVKDNWQTARKAAAAALLALDEVYIACDNSLPRYAYIGFDGRAELYTTVERAHSTKVKLDASAGIPLWRVQRYGRDDFEKLFAGCRDIGIRNFRVDNGFLATELQIDDLTAGKSAADANLFSLMLREAQFGIRLKALKEQKGSETVEYGALSGMLTMQNYARREIGNALLYVVVPDAAMGKHSAKTAIGRRCTKAAQPRMPGAMIDSLNGFVEVTDKRDGKHFIAAFTSYARAETFIRRMQANVHAVAAVFDDVAESCSTRDGILINADDLAYRIMRADFDRVRDLRAKPPVVVRVRKQEQNADSQSAEAAEKIVEPQSVVPMSAELPDPDQFLPKLSTVSVRDEAPAKPAPKKVPEIIEDRKKQRQGFFRRLFGKK